MLFGFFIRFSGLLYHFFYFIFFLLFNLVNAAGTWNGRTSKFRQEIPNLSIFQQTVVRANFRQKGHIPSIFRLHRNATLIGDGTYEVSDSGN